MKYPFILFDADSTLFDYDKAEAFALLSLLTNLGQGYSEELRSLYRTINHALWKQHEDGLIDIGTLQTERFRLFFEKIGIHENPAAFNALYLDQLAEGSQLIDGAYEVCKELSVNHTLAIVTNGVSRTQHKRVNASAIRPFIREVFVSGDIGHQKPEIEFFTVVFEKLGIEDKSQALIVGDSLASDMQGGVNSGIATCWFNPQGSANDRNVTVDYEIRKLTELTGIV